MDLEKIIAFENECKEYVSKNSDPCEHNEFKNIFDFYAIKIIELQNEINKLKEI